MADDAQASSDPAEQVENLDSAVAIITQKKTWFEDGNIVLEVETSRFKVYGGILALHSAIFRDMLAIPKPAVLDASETVDGCPAVRLEDRANDWEYVLAAIFERK